MPIFASTAAMERGWDCLRLFSEQLQDILSDNIRVVGTATLRLATNVDEFISEAERCSTTASRSSRARKKQDHL